MNSFVTRVEHDSVWHRQPQRQVPLRDALRDLDPIHQRFIALKFFQRLSTQQIAGVLGCSEDNVKLIQYHALKALQGRVRP